MISFLAELKLTPRGSESNIPLCEAVICLFLLIIYIFLSSRWNLDLMVQNYFFDSATREWLISKNNHFLRLIFYFGMKDSIAIFGGFLIIWGIFEYRRGAITMVQLEAALFVTTCLVLIPSTAALLKKLTGISCPYELDLYNGDHYYHGILDFHWPNGFKRSACFPAGHPSGGFALLALGYVSPRKKLFVGTALVAGGMMSFYQIARGAHFISHCVATLLISIFLIKMVYTAFLLRSTLFPSERDKIIAVPVKNYKKQ